MPFCKKCGAEIIDEGFLGYCGLNCMGDLSQHRKATISDISGQSYTSPISSLDYHGLPLFEAKNKLVEDVIETFETGAYEIQIIHGFKHGQAIKAYVWRKNGLLKEVKALRSDIIIKLHSSSSRGITIIRFHR
ncbi:MAG: hypothetical protein KAT16_06955 [Candidatus Heimdallarchaeota archaeon]|nr:hypothetical protein [Candidatus Heimdallarchaeota archaeon]